MGSYSGGVEWRLAGKPEVYISHQFDRMMIAEKAFPFHQHNQ
jgi:hypothetical protein